MHALHTRKEEKKKREVFTHAQDLNGEAELGGEHSRTHSWFQYHVYLHNVVLVLVVIYENDDDVFSVMAP